MTDEDMLANLEARLKSIPRWLEVVYLMSEIRKLKSKIEEKFISYDSGDPSNQT